MQAMERDYRAGTVDVMAFCEFYVGALSGRSLADWAPWLARFLDEEITPRLPAKARALVERHLNGGDLVVLSTATNRVLTERTAASLGIRHLIATECEVTSDGVLSGRLRGVPNMREGKVTRLKEWLAGQGLGLQDCESCFYSDSMNDLPLLLAVDHPVVVDADARLAAEAARRGWPAISLRD
jgi:HAD superfamily hydrolase (TIGR01490 family)